MKNADIAMYRSKDGGKDNYHFYSPAMQEKYYERLSEEANLRRALGKGELKVYYQPQVNLETGHIVGMEALVRWQHPKKGLVTPSRFIELAEETGMIVLIDLWILRTACYQYKKWLDAGIPVMSIAVNISGHTFRHDTLITVITDILKQTDIPHTALDLEITEGIAIQNLQTTINILNKLHSLDVQITIDDFGTGFSSLNYLSKFPIQKLKIGMSFVQDLEKDPKNGAIVTAIIAMAKSLKLKVIAEGVETQDQLQFLKGLKCEKIQGHLFSTAVPAAEMENMLKQKKHLCFTTDG